VIFLYLFPAFFLLFRHSELTLNMKPQNMLSIILLATGASLAYAATDCEILNEGFPVIPAVGKSFFFSNEGCCGGLDNAKNLENNWTNGWPGENMGVRCGKANSTVPVDRVEIM
jgi:hypothetical protein